MISEQNSMSSTSSVIEQLAAGVPEVTFGPSSMMSQLSRADADALFRRMNGGQ